MTKQILDTAPYLLFAGWVIFILWLATRQRTVPKVVDLPKNRRVLPKPKPWTPTLYFPDEERGGYQPKTPNGTALPPPKTDGRRRYWPVFGERHCDPMWPDVLVAAGKLGHSTGLCSGEGTDEI